MWKTVTKIKGTCTLRYKLDKKYSDVQPYNKILKINDIFNNVWLPTFRQITTH